MSASGNQIAVVRAKLKFATREEFIAGFTPLVSRAGLFIRTKSTKPQGTTIRFEFRLVDSTPIFVGEGTVRKELLFDESNPSKPSGMLVGLKRLNRVSKDILTEILARKEGKQPPSREKTKPRVEAPSAADETSSPEEGSGGETSSADETGTDVTGAGADGPEVTPQAQPVAQSDEDATPSSPSPAVAHNDAADTLVGGDSPLPAEARPEAPTADQAAIGEPEPQPLEREPQLAEPEPATPSEDANAGELGGGGLFGDVDDDEMDLFGELDQGLDDMFASAGMISDGAAISDAPVDMMGSALPMVNVGDIFEEEEEEGGLLSFDESDFEDDDDEFFADFDEPEDDEDESSSDGTEAPAEEARETPASEALLFAEPDEPSAAELPDLPNEPPSSPQAEESVNDLLGRLEDDDPVTPREESGLIKTPSILSEPAIDVDAMNRKLDQKAGQDAEGLQNLVKETRETEQRKAAERAATERQQAQGQPPQGRPPQGQPPQGQPPQGQPPQGQPPQQQAQKKPATRIPPPPGKPLPPASNPDGPPKRNDEGNPLDSVSVASDDLPPPPKARGFSSPSLNDLESEKPNKKGLFNKLFGKD